MADVNNKYGTTASTITITLDSLSATSMRESTAIDNSTNLFVDALVGGTLDINSSAAADEVITFFAYGTVDGGTTYTGNATGTDASYTGRDENLPILGRVTVNAGAQDLEFGPFSVARCFDGVLPQKWGIIVLCETTGGLDASTNNVDYQGVEGTVA